MFTRTPPTNKKLNTDQIQAILENESEDESRKEKMNEEDQKLAPVGEAEAKKQNKDASAKVEEKFEQMMNTLTQSMLAKSKQEGQVIIAAEKFEKVVSDCDGKSIPIKKWFEIFEKNAEAYELSEKQKYVQARSKMIGSAELFLESECVSGYTELKELLIEEFSGSYNSAVIHKKLQDRKKKREETLHDYLLQMKKIAALGEVETVALITHIVNGLDIKKEYKGAMLRCKTLKELKQEFEIYESLNIVDKPNIQPKPKQITQGVKADHCFNCGSREHKRKDCTLPTKCFSCNQEGYLNCIDKGDAPLHTLHIDHLGPMDSSAKQYKYILATVDAFSKFVWLFPTKSTGQEEVVKRLTDWSNIFGFPKRIVSDKGTAFTSGAFEQFMSSHNVEHVCTTTGVARGNGQIERVNRLILAIISKLSSDEPSKWYKYVPEVQKAINCHVHSSLKLSPFEVMFGTKMYTRVEDRLLELLQEEVVCQFNEDRYEMRQLVKRNIEQAQKDYKRNYDKKRRAEYKYKAGDLVAIKRTQFVAGRKMASGYLGPYEVTGVKDNGRYDVKKAANVEGPNVTSTSCDNMKLWKYIAENADLLSSGSDDEDQEGRM
ncbi:uncharacterized protein LOC117147645 isoform X3 [Drosophila mauritiana]|uniref:Uncharacterized protein LOC117147645 isoform X3 n=1 Tax=Drosophila mauritiana TaxID=7226 RepID=A0A6P8L5C5_DROMA|nr:uncharacterized protein LOC117147645 isoform X3 [Drosophila mauritiana]